jgi:D-glycero-alpha-D-manno-heptose 1-phosphate guanylyltransferase
VKAIVLVGGFGKRLQAVVPDLPKPMAPIANKPFLAYLFHYLQQAGITEFILPVHYLGERISAYFGSHFHGIPISYVQEDEPLGTGGAIVNAMRGLPVTEPVFVLNGDTFVQLDYQAMWDEHRATNAIFTMALRRVPNCARYGNVVVTNNRVTGFTEKGINCAGLISAGVYLLAPNLFTQFNMPAVFSIENDFLHPYLDRLKPHAFMSGNYFIDIGVPDDYQRACQELPQVSLI